jgi:uncharacterized membrane protein YphA (DoxX/SURF4 family)
MLPDGDQSLEHPDGTTVPVHPRTRVCQASMPNLTIALQALVATSIFFVWVVRYANIVQEFKQYALPDWLRDLVGILKLTCSVLLLIGIERPLFAVVGGGGIALLMGAAVVTHVRVKNPVFEMLPALTLLVLSAVIAWINYGLLTR